MKSVFPTPVCATAFLLAMTWSTSALADYVVTCESKGNRHTSCGLSQPGYVTVSRQLSGSGCRQGRDWDYDRREIWVDDGCRAEFKVHTYGYDSKSGGNDKAVTAAGVVVGVALLGALINNSKHKDDGRYSDDNYYGSQHSSYVPGWMVGTFEGYNAMYGASVQLTISSDGQATGFANGGRIDGWINDDRLHVENVVFNIDQVNDGFVTSQVGDRANEVRYRRVR